MSGQNNHFSNYAQEKIPYAMDRYRNEVNRLYGVMNKRLADRPFLAMSRSRRTNRPVAEVTARPGWFRPGRRHRAQSHASASKAAHGKTFAS